MTQNKFLTTAIVLGVLLLIGFSCKSINIPSFGGGGVNESTNPKDAVTSALKKFTDIKFYHSTTLTKNAQAEVSTEVEYNAPDKFWIKNNISNMKSEVIVVGNDSYIRINEGKWSKMPENQSPKIADLRGKITDEAFAAMKDFELVGKENLNGKDAIAYKFKSTYGGESSSKMWIATDTGLPLKVDTDGTYAENKITMSITYDYEKETKIEVPNLN